MGDSTKRPWRRSSAVETNEKAPERYFNFLGLVIVRKADLLAATAFLLAAGSTSYQVGGYLLGARLSTFAPAKVLVFFDHYSDGEIVTRFAGQLTFTNTGAIGRSGTIREAWIDVKGAGINLRQYWISFPEFARQEEGMKLEHAQEAFPLEVPGEGTVSKFTAYAPRVECIEGPDCVPTQGYVSDTSFLKVLSANVGGAVVLTFRANTFQGKDVAPSSCKLPITTELITFLAANDWFLGRCVPEET